jgi:poly-gamma-glutamate capsule biosynthesis protein CapA/YwtB (metallophosphatase superfamily)
LQKIIFAWVINGERLINHIMKLLIFFIKLILAVLFCFVLLCSLISCNFTNLILNNIQSAVNNSSVDNSSSAETTIPSSTESLEKKTSLKFYIENIIPQNIRTLISEQIGKDFENTERVNSKSDAGITFNIRLAEYLNNSNNNSANNNFNYIFKNPLVFVPVVSFFNFIEDISWEDFVNFWNGKIQNIHDISGNEVEVKLVLSQEIFDILQKNLGNCNIKNLQILKNEDIPAALKNDEKAISIIPFDQIKPELKVLNVGGMSVFDKDLNMLKYPLAAFIEISSLNSQLNSEIVDEIKTSVDELSYSNRDVSKLVTINMTGVTALTRQIAGRMDEKGILYPAEKILDVLKDADITHISNEISFVENCYAARPNTVVFCSKPEYIDLLKYIGTDVIELTGNHLNDYGSKWLTYTLDIYDKEGIKYFGGGRNIADSYKPAIFNINGCRFAFIGANSFGPASDWAGENTPGSARINMWDDVQKENDMKKFEDIVKELKQQGYIVIFTFQYMETYNYFPTDQQVKDFRRISDAGADIVSGSQAHQPQGVEIRDDGFINYGLGNLFFGQASGQAVKQGIIARHIFYNGKYINTVLITTYIEDLSQPRVTAGDERAELLKVIFNESIK